MSFLTQETTEKVLIDKNFAAHMFYGFASSYYVMIHLKTGYSVFLHILNGILTTATIHNICIYYTNSLPSIFSIQINDQNNVKETSFGKHRTLSSVTRISRDC